MTPVLFFHLPLLHERPDCKPEAVGQREVILEDESGVHAGVRMGPLVGGEAGHDPNGQRHQNIGY